MNIEEAYEKFSQELTNYLIKHFGQSELCQDAAQMAFAKAALSLPYIRQMPEAALRAWLYAAARNALIDALRKQKRLEYGFDFDALQSPAPPDPADRIALRDGIGQLSELKRRLILMRYDQGWNASEISQAENMPASTVRYHLRTAIQQLRRQLKEEES